MNKGNRRKSNNIDPHVIEAQRLAEEEKKRDEEMRILEEKRKFEVVKLQSGLELILTEWSISESWKSTRPKQVFLVILNRYFRTNHIMDNFESIEINILSEFISNAMIYAKEELLLDNFRSTLFVNLIFFLLRNDNLNYTEKSKVTNPLKNKTWERDYESFSNLILKHSVNKDKGTKYFDAFQVRKIYDYAESCYFSQFGLLKYAFGDQQKNEEIHFKVKVENPLIVPPLTEALFKNINYFEIRDDEEKEAYLLQNEVSDTEQVEEISYRNESKIQSQNEFNDIDPHDLEFIENKIKEAEDKMRKTFEERQNQLELTLEQMKSKKK